MTGNDESLFVASELRIVGIGLRFHFKVCIVSRLMKFSLKFFSQKTDADVGVQSNAILFFRLFFFQRKVECGNWWRKSCTTTESQ